MNSGRSARPDIGERLVDRRKSVARVGIINSLDTVGTVVPIRAIKTLVTNTKNALVTAVTDSVMHAIAAGAHLDMDTVRHLSTLYGRGKPVLRMMAMGILGEA